MIFRVTMKCPDTLNDAIECAANDEVNWPTDSEEHDILFNELVEKITNLCNKWFKYGEYITVEIDTETETCVVLHQW